MLCIHQLYNFNVRGRIYKTTRAITHAPSRYFSLRMRSFTERVTVILTFPFRYSAQLLRSWYGNCMDPLLSLEKKYPYQYVYFKVNNKIFYEKTIGCFGPFWQGVPPIATRQLPFSFIKKMDEVASIYDSEDYDPFDYQEEEEIIIDYDILLPTVVDKIRWIYILFDQPQEGWFSRGMYAIHIRTMHSPQFAVAFTLFHLQQGSIFLLFAFLLLVLRGVLFFMHITINVNVLICIYAAAFCITVAYCYYKTVDASLVIPNFVKRVLLLCIILYLLMILHPDVVLFGGILVFVSMHILYIIQDLYQRYYYYVVNF